MMHLDTLVSGVGPGLAYCDGFWSIFRPADGQPNQVGGTMFPFWEIGVGKWPVNGSGKPAAKFLNFSRSLVSLRPGISRNSRISELTSGGWNS